MIATIHQSLDGAFHLRWASGWLHRNGGNLHGNRTVARQAGAHRTRLVLSAGNQHGPSVQSAVFPPGVLGAQRWISLRTDGHQQFFRDFPVLGSRARGCSHGFEGVQGDVIATLAAGGGVRGHGGWSVARDVPLLQLLGDPHQVLWAGGEDQGQASVGQLIPVRALPHVSGGHVRPHADSGEGRNGRSTRHAGDHLELHVQGLGQGGDFLQLSHNRFIAQRVAGNQAHHVIALLGALHHLGSGDLVLIREHGRLSIHHLCCGGWLRPWWLASGSRLLGGLELALPLSLRSFQLLFWNRHVGGDQPADASGHGWVHPGIRGVFQHFAGPDSQEIRVSRPRSHKEDAAGAQRGISGISH